MTTNSPKKQYRVKEEKFRAEGAELRRTWCGPTVLLLLTGLPYDQIKAEINRRRNKRLYNKRTMGAAVKGLGTGTMAYMLKKHGMKPEYKKVKGMTLKTFCEDVAHLKQKMVIVSGNHYLILSDGWLYDTYQTEGCPYQEHPFYRTRMEGYWKIKHDGPLHVDHALTTRYTKPEPKKKAPKPKRDIKQERYEKAKAALKKWETKKKRAETAIKKYRKTVKYYEKQGLK